MRNTCGRVLIAAALIRRIKYINLRAGGPGASGSRGARAAARQHRAPRRRPARARAPALIYSQSALRSPEL